MKLLAGPYCGEFGWTLFCWQAYLRWVSQQQEFDSVIICGHDDTKALYNDFCTEWVSHNEWPIAPDCYTGRMKISNWWNGRYTIGDVLFRPNTKHVHYSASWGSFWQEWDESFRRQSFISYGNSGDGYDCLLHIRSTTKNGTGYRNWADNKWLELTKLLISEGVSIGCVGSHTAAHHIDGCDDLRGLSLDKITDIMASSKMIVGPSSGPLHLASLCKCHQVVWSPMYNYNRYMYHWNPFNTKVSFIDEGCPGRDSAWNPSVNTVLNSVMKVINAHV